MLKPKKIPQRQCVGCRTMKNKRDLIRVVKSPAGEISLDFVGKKPGRGAYLCPDSACLTRARKTKALERAFETAIPAEIYDALLAQMEAADGT
ncbi:MAG: YlxR family protein [Clostridiales bacterium]|nr:YlxR family protein [bacterium 210917-SL.2.15]MCI5843697.1 YlxR family protein [Clostridiales bacterium]MDY4037432.1 YlxR family protein [Candidatus Pseudoscilispira sp.]